jgi:MFS family permease
MMQGDAVLPRFFRWLWLGQGLSMVGTQVTTVAVPLTAVMLLGAGPAAVGALSAAAYLPWLLALPVGVWVDRLPRRRLLLAAESTRAVVLLTIPVAAVADRLSVPLLCAVVAVVGAGQVLFETAWGSVLPGLLGRRLLLAAHGRLEGTRASADVAGPAAAGGLVALVGAPFAMILDAVSYLVSLATVARWVPASLCDGEATSAAGGTGTSRRSMRAEAGEGMRFLFRHRVLRAVAVEAALYNVFATEIESMLVLYAVNRLGLTASQFGLLLSVGALGAVAGAAGSGRIVRRLHLGPGYLVTTGLACVSMLLIPLPAQPGPAGVALVAAGLALGGFGASSSSVYAVTLRQCVVPDALLGRVLGVYRLLSYGCIPLGGLVTAVLGEALGPRGAIAVCAVTLLCAPVPLLLSPIRSVRTVDDAADLAGVPAMAG